MTAKISFVQLEFKVHATRTMIKLLIVSALLVYVKSDDYVLRNYRKIMSLGMGDILSVQNSTKSFSEFSSAKFPWSSNELDQTDLAVELQNDFIDTTMQFAVRVHEYYSNKLQSYCQQLIAFIDLLKTQDDDQSLVDIIRFDERHLCLASFIFHFGLPVDPMVRIVQILQSVSDKTKIDYIVTELKLFVQTNEDRIRALNKYNEPAETSHGDYQSKIEFEDLKSEILGIKETLLQFSTEFYLLNVPSLVVTKFPKIDRQNSNNFLKYLFHDEHFTVKFIQENKYKQNKIIRWNCYSVSRTPEYNINVYAKKIKEEVFDASFELLPEFKTTDDILSLDQLQDKLASNSYYFNNVILSNIVLEVIILVAMKEGRKILRVANDTSNRCADHLNSITPKEIRIIVASLTQFKLIYDDLMKVIDSVIPLNESTNDLETIFDTQLTGTVALFYKSSHMEHSDFLPILCSTDTKISTLDKVNRSQLNFSSFYLISPLKYIKTLYDFTSKLIYPVDDKIFML